MNNPICRSIIDITRAEDSQPFFWRQVEQWWTTWPLVQHNCPEEGPMMIERRKSCNWCGRVEG